MQYDKAYSILDRHINTGLHEIFRKVNITCMCGWSKIVDPNDPLAAHKEHLKHVAKIISKGG